MPTSPETMTGKGCCDLCRAESPRYDFDRVCCLARYLIGIPHKAARDAWAARLASRYGEATVAEAQRIGAAVWHRRREGVGRALAEVLGGEGAGPSGAGFYAS